MVEGNRKARFSKRKVVEKASDFWKGYNGNDRQIIDFDDVDEIVLLENELDNLESLPFYAKKESFNKRIKAIEKRLFNLKWR